MNRKYQCDIGYHHKIGFTCFCDYKPRNAKEMWAHIIVHRLKGDTIHEDNVFDDVKEQALKELDGTDTRSTTKS